LSRRRPPNFEGHPFCSEACLRAHVSDEISHRWSRPQHETLQRIPRPRLGSILMQTASITREQLDEAVRLQREAGEGKVGEWLRHIGAVDERQVTVALARQFGLPMIDLLKSEAHGNAVRMVPAPVAVSAKLLPVSCDDEQDSLRIAVSGPVNFNVQGAIRRMIGKGVSAYICDQTAIELQLARCYPSQERDMESIPIFSTLEELLEIVERTIAGAASLRATDIRAELFENWFWGRVELGSEFKHYFYRRMAGRDACEKIHSMAEENYAVAAGGMS
jgi:hypothetical protein